MKKGFYFQNDVLYCDRVNLYELALKTKTPFWVYSESVLKSGFLAWKNAFRALNTTICYSVKSLSNINILKILASLGSGFDIVSGGELFRVQKANGDMSKTVFAGVGKTETEIISALKANIRMFNCESFEEIQRINILASKMKKTANCAIRLNPDINPDTHHHITTGHKENKFGILFDDLKKFIPKIKKFSRVNISGIHFHIGSQILSVKPFVESLKKVMFYIDRLTELGLEIHSINIGGGLGIPYQKDQKSLPVSELADSILPLLRNRGLELFVEPGRSISAPAGILIVQVQYIKKSGKKTFIITDGGMNDLIRPAFYNAYHEILPLRKHSGTIVADVVGPVCESSDFFAKDRTLSKIKQGDFLAIMNSGAYGSVMSSRYNSRPFIAELIVSDNTVNIIRKNESLEDLIKNEVL